MTQYIVRGNSIYPTADANLVVKQSLDAGTYVVRYDSVTDEYYLDGIDDFAIPEKIYGDSVAKSKRVITTFNSRKGSTGVLLEGLRGSGKSLLSKLVSNELLKCGVPTIVVNEPHHGDTFNAFVQSIDQPAVIIFDEFEKVYTHCDQEKILTLLDGVFPTKKLFMLTVNETRRVNDRMFNRPGRIFYTFSYKGLDADFITEYCNDTLLVKEHASSILKISAMFPDFSFDMLQSIVEECNRYNETPEQVISWLNMRPAFSTDVEYGVTVFDNDVKLEESKHTSSLFGFNPFVTSDSIVIYRESEDGDDIVVSLTPDKIIAFVKASNEIKYSDGKYTVVLKPLHHEFDFTSLL